jgi:mRNA interferase MazF
VTRGDIVVVASRGADTRKPRPALIVQADAFNPTHAGLSLCPITSDCVDAPLFRIAVPGGLRTGLERDSQVMIDKIVSVPREAIGRTVGRLGSSELEIVDAALRRWLAL